MNFTKSLMRLRVGCNWSTFHERAQRKKGVRGVIGVVWEGGEG